MHSDHDLRHQGHLTPVRRTEFGSASILMSWIALLTGWVPYTGYFVMTAASVLVLAGLVGRHERSRVPASIGLALLITAAVLHLTMYLGTLGWAVDLRSLIGR